MKLPSDIGTNPDYLALFSVDPGGITGCARGVFDMSLRSTWTCLAEAKRERRMEAWEVEGDVAEQAAEIVGEYRDWSHELAARGFRLAEIDLLCEDFQLRPGRKSDKRLLWPVEIRACLQFWCYDQKRRAPILQQPSQAMTTATNKRLKTAGVYIAGRDHKRDAIRHLALRVHNKLR